MRMDVNRGKEGGGGNRSFEGVGGVLRAAAGCKRTRLSGSSPGELLRGPPSVQGEGCQSRGKARERADASTRDLWYPGRLHLEAGEAQRGRRGRSPHRISIGARPKRVGADHRPANNPIPQREKWEGTQVTPKIREGWRGS